MLLIFPIVRNIDPPWTGLPINTVTEVTGTAAADSRKTTGGSYILELEAQSVASSDGRKADASGTVLLLLDTDPQVYMGERLAARGLLGAPEEVSAMLETQRSLDYPMLKAPPVLFCRSNPEDISRSGWRSEVFRIRGLAVERIIGRCVSMGPEAGGLFLALFTGRRDGLSAEETRVFRRAGCSHILALSGMHLGILSGMMLLLLKPLPWKKPSFIITGVAVFAYLFLTGFGISLVRAAVMFFICAAAGFTERRFRGPDVLLLSFVVLTLLDPASFYTAAFQLSFLAVAGILLLSPVLIRLLKPWMPSVLAAALAASIGAQLFVLPLVSRFFGEIYPAGTGTGIIIAPLVTVFIWIGIIYLVTGAGAAASLAGLLYRLVFRIAERAALIPAVNAEKPAVVLFFCGTVTAMLVLYAIYGRGSDGIPGKLRFLSRAQGISRVVRSEYEKKVRTEFSD